MTDQQPADMPDWERRLIGHAADELILRDRIARAIRAAVRIYLGADVTTITIDDDGGVRLDSSEADNAARAVMAVVQPEVDALRQRAEQAEAILRKLRVECTQWAGRWCLTHSQKAPCPHEEAARHLAALDGTEPKDQP